MTKLIAFRVDGSEVIGAGHVARCLTLANVLRSEGAETVFICRHLPLALATQIETQGHGIRRLQGFSRTAESDFSAPYADWLGLTWQEDAEETAETIVTLGTKPDWLVVDHYALDANWEGVLRSLTRCVMAIDDLADRHHDCDLLLDQNHHADAAARYAGLVPPDCEALLGPRYALLRPEFSVWRDRSAELKPAGRNVAVFFGSADATNETLRTIEQLVRRPDGFAHVHVVTGSINPNLDLLRARCQALVNCSLHVDTPEMARVLAAADLVIGAGGSNTWERACLRSPSLVIATAPNQIPVAESLAEAGAHLYLGESAEVSDGRLHDAIEFCMANPRLLRFFSRQSAALCDGLGARRVASRMHAGEIQVRPATMDDCEKAHEWRNAEETRRHFFDPMPILRQDHYAWFARTLGDPARVLLIGELDGEAIGVLRYDLHDETAMVSIYLDPRVAGAGRGASLLRSGARYLAAAHPQVRKVLAHILPDNMRSISTFRSAGFALENHTYRLNL